MFSRYYKNIIDKFSSPLNDIDILPYFNEDKPLEDEFPYNYDSLSLKEFSSSEDISNDNLNTFSISKMMDNPFEIISEDNDIEKDFNDLFIEIKNSPKKIDNKNKINIFCLETVKNKEEKNIFKVVFPSNYDTKENKEDNYSKVSQKDILLAGKRKRFSFRRQRKDNRDNIRKKIKRGFFNNGLIKKLNEKLKSIGSKKYLRKFPQHFVSDVNQKRNKELFNMTLREIFENKQLYINEDKEGFRNYLNNLKVIQNEEIKENEELKIIFNKTINELYEEYINSDEFNIIEINRLKEKKMQDDYIKRYINLARYLILFFTQ